MSFEVVKDVRRAESAEPSEQAYKNAEMFLQHSHDQKYKNIWNAFTVNPKQFFTEENLEKLGSFLPHERLMLLARASLYVVITPQDAEQFFRRFPSSFEDLKALILIQNFRADDGLQLQLFTLTFGFLPKQFKADLTKPVHEKSQEDFNKENWLEVWQRRRLPGLHILSNYSQDIYEKIAMFGDASAGYRKVVNEAHEMENQMGGNVFLDVGTMLTGKAFLELPELKKAEMLRLCIAEMQYSFVFQEVFNSAFTNERVREDAKNYAVEAQKKQHEKRELELYRAMKVTGREHQMRPFTLKHVRRNTAHSILFETEHPISVFSSPQKVYEGEMRITAQIGGAVEEYPYHKIVLEVLKALARVTADVDTNTDLLVEFWIKNQNPIFANALADALSKQNPRRAAALLFKEIQNPERKNKNAIAAILYRLELGNIAIGKEGVWYLNRLYDLGEFNNPDFFVRRLTVTGTMGVFGQQKELLRLFELGDITDGATIVRAEALGLTADMLFGSQSLNPNGDDVLVRERLVEDFTKKYFEFYGDSFFKRTGIAYNNLTLREQGWFLHYVHRGGDEEEKGRCVSLAAKYGEVFLKLFLGVQYDAAVGKQILAFAEKQSDERLVKKVFAVFLELLAHAESAEDYITKTFGTSGTAHETVKASMIASALGLLRVAAESGDEAKVRKIVDALANAPKIALTVGSKALKRSGELTEENIHNIGAYVPLVQRGGDMSQEYRDTIRTMQLAQYKDRAGGYQSIIDVGGGRKIPLWQALDESLVGALTSADSRFYLLIPPQDTKIPLAASLRFDDRADGVHMASVMTALDGSGVGELHAQASFEKERDMLAKERIYAECDRASGITQKYHEWGFVTTSLGQEGELKTLAIEWRKERGELETLAIKEGWNHEAIVRKATQHARKGVGDVGSKVCYRVHDTPSAETGEPPVPESEFELLKHGYVMTRYFTDKKTKQNYAVFEQDPLDPRWQAKTTAPSR